uniref:Homoserine dehydrogenase n=1 Tax=Methylobacillus glycogenes TaxID=406 RepID=DHOM_METGL|nr:RecName: Full=Homoserine dehydrogenase; Short=HDH [Methylobacillus glycogenes]BAA40414.1 homoserine dehydrogenase [Methylobacillus glycogenes]
MKPINVGLLGIGTVGGGTYTVLTRNQEGNRAPCRPPNCHHARRDRNLELARKVTGGQIDVTDDAFAVVVRPRHRHRGRIDRRIHHRARTGYEGDRERQARVAANKALMLAWQRDFRRVAQQKGVIVAFEAAVAGGIPIIKAVAAGAGRQPSSRVLRAIINGTTNFILSEMREKGLAFADVLKEAQPRLCEATRPSTSRAWTAHKLMILAAIGFGIPMQFDKAYVEGISKLDALDIRYAEELGYRQAAWHAPSAPARGVELARAPDPDPRETPDRQCQRRHNAVLVSDACRSHLVYRPDACRRHASAVVADIVDGTRTAYHRRAPAVPHLLSSPTSSWTCRFAIGEVSSAYYLRLRAVDKPGRDGHVTRILATGSLHRCDDSEGNRRQAERRRSGRHHHPDHVTVEKNMDDAIVAIEALPAISGSVTRLRMEELSR